MIESPSEVARLVRAGTPLDEINFSYMCYHDDELSVLADLLIENPNSITRLIMPVNVSKDEVGVKFARAASRSTTIEHLNLSGNCLTERTYLAVADALHVNSSLSKIHLFGNQSTDRTSIDAAFVKALRFNPCRPADSCWILYTPHTDRFKPLSEIAEQLGAPSMNDYLDDMEED